MRCVAAILSACALASAVAGCGGGGGVSSGARVAVYADSGLCAAAQQELADADGRAGEIRVRLVCTAAARGGGRLDLAAVGASARRATEDSAAVAYLEDRDAAANRFAQPILEAADIGWTEAADGAAAMRRTLDAIEAADGGSLRDEVRESLES